MFGPCVQNETYILRETNPPSDHIIFLCYKTEIRKQIYIATQMYKTKFASTLLFYCISLCSNVKFISSPKHRFSQFLELMHCAGSFLKAYCSKTWS